eukprot:SAG11_NODE_33068_length_279_cov_0.850000_1_plen_44_part_01
MPRNKVIEDERTQNETQKSANLWLEVSIFLCQSTTELCAIGSHL